MRSLAAICVMFAGSLAISGCNEQLPPDPLDELLSDPSALVRSALEGEWLVEVVVDGVVTVPSSPARVCGGVEDVWFGRCEDGLPSDDAPVAVISATSIPFEEGRAGALVGSLVRVAGVDDGCAPTQASERPCGDPRLRLVGDRAARIERIEAAGILICAENHEAPQACLRVVAERAE